MGRMIRFRSTISASRRHRRVTALHQVPIGEA
jgi:hypothetical protein